jgi:predicted glycoside hydrolase/deacetylase ChbG (UPF0249 family)
MKKGERKSIFTADDFGATEFINMGTNRGIEKGLINSVAVMVNFPGAIDNIADLKKKHPHISLGLHANITAGYPVSPANAVPSLVDDQGHFHTLQELIRRIRQIKVKEVLLEIRAQLGILEEAGLVVEHLSSHHNIMQIYTPFFNVLLELAKEKKMYMRSTKPFSRFLSEFKKSPIAHESKKAAMELIIRHQFAAIKMIKYGTRMEMQKNQDRMDQHQVSHPDYLGDAFWGNPTAENLRHILHNQPEGITEWVFHLGYSAEYGEVPKGIDQEYYRFRKLELSTLCSSELPTWLERENIQLIRYSDIK